jgi:hypothetical protein
MIIISVTISTDFRGNQGIDNVIEIMMNSKRPRRYDSVEDKTCHSRTKHSLQARL